MLTTQNQMLTTRYQLKMLTTRYQIVSRHLIIVFVCRYLFCSPRTCNTHRHIEVATPRLTTTAKKIAPQSQKPTTTRHDITSTTPHSQNPPPIIRTQRRRQHIGDDITPATTSVFLPLFCIHHLLNTCLSAQIVM